MMLGLVGEQLQVREAVRLVVTDMLPAARGNDEALACGHGGAPWCGAIRVPRLIRLPSPCTGFEARARRRWSAPAACSRQADDRDDVALAHAPPRLYPSRRMHAFTPGHSDTNSTRTEVFTGSNSSPRLTCWGRRANVHPGEDRLDLADELIKGGRGRLILERAAQRTFARGPARVPCPPPSYPPCRPAGTPRTRPRDPLARSRHHCQ